MFHGLGVRVDELEFRLVNHTFFFVKVNQMVINVFYPSLKIMVKVVSVNMKSSTLKIVFLTIFFVCLIFTIELSLYFLNT